MIYSHFSKWPPLKIVKILALTLKPIHLERSDLHLNICFKVQGIHLTYLQSNNIDNDDVFLATTRVCVCVCVCGGGGGGGGGVINDAYRLLDSNKLFMPFEINDECPANDMDPVPNST